jgi:hypothetical protein
MASPDLTQPNSHCYRKDARTGGQVSVSSITEPNNKQKALHGSSAPQRSEEQRVREVLDRLLSGTSIADLSYDQRRIARLIFTSKRVWQRLVTSVIDIANSPGPPRGRTLVEGQGERHFRRRARILLACLTDARAGDLFQIIVNGFRRAPVEELGRCPICSRFFWRDRKDQRCCCKACANVYRVRRWRQRYSESYKLQRFRRAEARRGAAGQKKL